MCYLVVLDTQNQVDSVRCSEVPAYNVIMSAPSREIAVFPGLPLARRVALGSPGQFSGTAGGPE